MKKTPILTSLPFAFGVLAASALPSFAVTPENAARAQTLAEEEESSLIEIFKKVHANPELAFMESETAALVAEELKSLGYEVETGIGKTGVTAVMKNGEGPTVMFRSDMDGLPVKEETGLPYASTKVVELPDGSSTHVAHACGHDAHVAWLIGIARVMAEMKEEWQGTLVLIAQPAEETIEGASAMVEDGLYDHVPAPDILISAHVTGIFPAGTVGMRAGRRMAGTDQIDVTVTGIGGHGSAPQYAIDPVVLGAQNVLDYQTIVSRNIDPQAPAVITVGAFQSGHVNNVIPETATLKLNLRWYETAVRDKMIERIKTVTEANAVAAGVPEERLPTYKMKGYALPVINDEEAVNRARPVLIAALGEDKVLPGIPPVMGSEDFPMLAAPHEDTQILFVEIGSGKPDVFTNYMKHGIMPPMNHNPKFQVELPAVVTGVKANSVLLLEFLKKG